jgi:2-methylcitrate dehydratase PrpD
VIGAFAAACAVGRLLELTPEQLVHAQGAALSMAAGNLQFLEDGAWTKRLHAGWAAQTGITAAMLAAAGVVAPTAPYAGRYGLYHAYLDEAGRSGVDLSLATASLPGGEGEPVWELLNIAVKPFAMCHFVHAAADAAIALHRQGVVVEHIREVTVLVPETAVAIVCEPLAQKRQPQTDYDAKFSLPYAVACGLIRGKLGLKELEPEALQAASVKALMVRVSYAVDPDTTFPRHYSGEVRITLYDGTQLSHRESVNRGHPDSPLINQEVQDKFMDNACLHFSSEHARAVVGQVLSLERLPSARTLEDLLSQEPTRPS